MQNKSYFRNLNALRFFAALCVVFHHVEQYKYWANLPNAWGNYTVDAIGQKAVSFFFVLSGFLITYLLLQENLKTGKIDIRNFYVRRILRIWPLYFLVVFLCFALPTVIDTSVFSRGIEPDNYVVSFLLLLLLLPDLLRILYPTLIGGNQLWTVGVEEQFYIFWPVLLRLFIRRIPVFLLVFIFAKFVVTFVLEELIPPGSHIILNKLFVFTLLFKVEQLAIGALGAWLVFARKEKMLSFICSVPVLVLAVAAAFVLFMVPLHSWYVSYPEAVVFIVLLLNLTLTDRLPFSLEHPVLLRAGEISYGIYMFHPLCIALSITFLQNTGIFSNDWVMFNVFLYSASVLLTLTLAGLSYRYYEAFFLGIRHRFTVAHNGGEQGNRKFQKNKVAGAA